MMQCCAKTKAFRHGAGSRSGGSQCSRTASWIDDYGNAFCTIHAKEPAGVTSKASGKIRADLRPIDAPENNRSKSVQDADERIDVPSLSRGARDVIAERRRQIEVEGWTPEHDDSHSKGEMAQAAACYALGSDGVNYIERLGMRGHVHRRRIIWPWSLNWWKPKDRRRDLVRSAALIIAELDRLDRIAERSIP